MKYLIVIAALLLSACLLLEDDTRRTSRGNVRDKGDGISAPVMCHDTEGNPYRVAEGYWSGCEWRECDWDGWVVDSYTCYYGCWESFCNNSGCWDEWFNVNDGYYTYYGLVLCECTQGYSVDYWVCY